jgi:hypothetical protein
MFYFADSVDDRNKIDVLGVNKFAIKPKKGKNWVKIEVHDTIDVARLKTKKGIFLGRKIRTVSSYGSFKDKNKIAKATYYRSSRTSGFSKTKWHKIRSYTRHKYILAFKIGYK